eukprot:5901116-Pleurochrysis_carterae.AAC.1
MHSVSCETYRQLATVSCVICRLCERYGFKEGSQEGSWPSLRRASSKMALRFQLALRAQAIRFKTGCCWGVQRSKLARVWSRLLSARGGRCEHRAEVGVQESRLRKDSKFAELTSFSLLISSLTFLISAFSSTVISSSFLKRLLQELFRNGEALLLKIGKPPR